MKQERQMEQNRRGNKYFAKRKEEMMKIKYF